MAPTARRAAGLGDGDTDGMGAAVPFTRFHLDAEEIDAARLAQHAGGQTGTGATAGRRESGLGSRDDAEDQDARGAAKRFKKTATGKFTRSKAFKRHILTSKTTKSKRQMRGSEVVHAADTPRLKKMLPYD